MRRILGLSLVFVSGTTMGNNPYSVVEKSVMDLQSELSTGKITSEQLVKAYLERIKTIDKAGPSLHSVIVINPQALSDARRLDDERRAGHVRGPLHGIPVLVKDNMDTNDGTATTAGSLALKDNVTLRNAPVIQRLKDAGAVILGKTNLTEWNNSRSTHAITGWSAIGGLVKNPYVLDRSAGGSSSGTGAAIAASLATVGVGAETDGSITSPAAFCGLVGLKPTVGLVSRTYVVPISHSQDTPGPMGRSIEDVAILLTAMAGSDPADPATTQADAHRRDYTSGLATASLKDKRIGILSFATGFSPEVDKVFAAAISILKAEGADVIELKDFVPPSDLGETEVMVWMSELKYNLSHYLSTTPSAVKTRTLKDLIAFNQTNSEETVLFNQELFEQAEATNGLNDPVYLDARAYSLLHASSQGIDKLITDNHLDALIAPSFGPAWRIDLITGDHYSGGMPSKLAAIAGYPHLTVPMGQIKGLPVGLSMIGPAWSEASLLALGYAFERASKARKPPTFITSLESLEHQASKYSQ